MKSIPEPNTGCWLWASMVDPCGYGRLKVAGRLLLAHRVAYEQFVGLIPDGLQLDHLCRVRCCVNPQHLEPVTSRENTLRGHGPAAEMARKPFCVRGHSLTDESNVYRWRGKGRICRACAKLRGRKQGVAS